MIYLDNNATTPVDPDVLEEMLRVAGTAIGNPGSRHVAGRRARQVLETARETIAGILDAAPEEVVFTSGGTESSNLALMGMSHGRYGDLLLPPGEHPATEEPVKRLIAQGWQRRSLEIDSSGRLSRECVESVSLQGVQLATAILAHNETGVIHDLGLLSQRCLEHGIPFHVDGVQAVGKIPVSFRSLQATTLSAAAHKFHGPRGIGVLLVRKGTRLTSLFAGGHQEQGMRPGTEPVMLAAGMSFALQKWQKNQVSRTQQTRELRDHLQQLLLEGAAPAVVNGDQENRLSNTLSIAFPGCDADALLIALDLAGVCCSLGSACASGSNEPSPILVAMQLPESQFKSSLRLSVSMFNTMEEIDQAARIIIRTVQGLRDSRRSMR